MPQRLMLDKARLFGVDLFCMMTLSAFILCLQVGGTEEYMICEAIKDGRITKKIVCWCIGTCAKMFNSDVSMVN